jgi:hypothetical protein
VEAELHDLIVEGAVCGGVCAVEVVAGQGAEGGDEGVLGEASGEQSEGGGDLLGGAVARASRSCSETVSACLEAALRRSRVACCAGGSGMS